MLTDANGNAYQFFVNLPFGETLAEQRASGAYSNVYKFTGKELDAETGLYYHGARYYDPGNSIWLSVDAAKGKYPSHNPYNYCLGNPVLLVDPDGREPIKPLAGTILTFMSIFNNTPTKIGLQTGAMAGRAMSRLGSTEWNWGKMQPLPAVTPYFNNRKGRYVYTENGGWIDMVHFLFYAGKAYNYKLQKEQAIDFSTSKSFPLLKEEAQHAVIKKALMDPVGEAVQDGFLQEKMDGRSAKHSAYSYEDLPSDKFGADFGANYFDPSSKLSLGEQLQGYMNNVLKATAPEDAPNYNLLPTRETEKPTRTNFTTTPIFIEE